MIRSRTCRAVRFSRVNERYGEAPGKVEGKRHESGSTSGDGVRAYVGEVTYK